MGVVSLLPGGFTHTGFALGGQLQRVLAPNIFLRVGALYSMRGGTGTQGGTPFTVKANYLEFPVVVGYDFAVQGSQMMPYVMAGGQFALKMSCNTESGGVSQDCNIGLGGTVSSTDIGLTGGAGVGFAAGRGTIKVDVRYLLGLTNGISSVAGAELKNKGFTIAAGYMVPFGH